MRTSTPCSILLVAGSVGCSFMARGPEQYRDDTAAVLQSKQGDIKACYDGVLKNDAGAAGRVTVNFTVERKTGTVTAVQVDPSSTAPQPVQDCVASSLQGLKLAPEDRRDGLATFSWDFTPNTPAAPAAPEAPAAS